MKKRNYLFAVSILFNAAFIVTLIFFLVKQDGGSRRSSYRSRPERERFDLSEEVQDKLDKVRRAFWQKTSEEREGIRRNRMKIGELLQETPPDTEAIHMRLDSIGMLQTKLEKMIIRQVWREREIYPEEYRDSYLNMIRRRYSGDIHHRRPRSRSDGKKDTVRKEEAEVREKPQQ